MAGKSKTKNPVAGSPFRGASSQTGSQKSERFELVVDVQGLADLEDDWTALFERLQTPTNPFLSFNWNWLWCHHYLAGEFADKNTTLCILVGRRNGRIDMIWPMSLTSSCGIRLLSFIGAPVSQYGDILAGRASSTPDRLLSAWQFVCRHLSPDVFIARKVRTDSAIAPFLASNGALVTQRDNAFFADLSVYQDSEAFNARFSSRYRKNERRQIKRLNEKGQLRFEVLRDSETAANLANQAIDMKIDWLRQNGHISPGFGDCRYRGFFRSVAAGRHPTGCLVSVYSLDARALAIEVGVGVRGHYCAHIGAFDQQFSAFGPGSHQIGQTIGHLMTDGWRTYDFLAPKSAYKRLWADSSIEVCDYALPANLKGRAYATGYLKWTRPKLKSALLAISVPTRKALANK